MELKRFQRDVLKTLGKFLGDVQVTGDVAGTFARYAPSQRGGPAVYVSAPGLGEVPYVCLRIPTGGGKTILGAHAISTVRDNFSGRDYPFIIWLVTTDTIRRQTADALKDKRHPYREALDEALGGKVDVFDADEIDRIRPADLRSKVCFLVSTIQAFRVEDRSIRNAYADKESLEAFFAGVDEDGLERVDGENRPKYSFVNLMRMCTPVVIVDEAHNVRTPASFRTLAGFRPSCILELSATPEIRNNATHTPSNILVSVHTGELKEAEMVKLPIVLSVQPDGWKQAVTCALQQQRRLLQLASGEDDYVRPLLLVQAQNTGGEAGVEEVKAYLLEEGVAESAIKIATGEQRELEGVDLLSRETKVDVVRKRRYGRGGIARLRMCSAPCGTFRAQHRLNSYWDACCGCLMRGAGKFRN